MPSYNMCLQKTLLILMDTFKNQLTLISSLRQELYIWYIAGTFGKPKYCLISARSMKAKSIVAVIFEVAKIKTFECILILSICVKRAFTTLIESDGSFSEINTF